MAGRVQGIRSTSHFPAEQNRNCHLHWPAGLHLLLCAGTMALCQIAASPSKLPTTGRSVQQSSSPRVSRRHLEQGPRCSKVEEGSALQCQERGAFRGNRFNHPHGFGAATTRSCLQPTRNIPLAQRNQLEIPGPGVHVPSRHFRVLPWRRQEASRHHHQQFEDGKRRFSASKSCWFALRHVWSLQR